jgi:hypothetical protein
VQRTKSREPRRAAELVALRSQVGEAGNTTGRLRRLVLGLMVLLLMLCPYFETLGQYGHMHVAGTGDLVALFAFTGLALALPYAAAYRFVRRLQLRRRLAALPPEQIAAVLLPLRDEPGDTRKIVAPLLRQFHPHGTELVPSAAPAGRGDEPSAVAP